MREYTPPTPRKNKIYWIHLEKLPEICPPPLHTHTHTPLKNTIVPRPWTKFRDPRMIYSIILLWLFSSMCIYNILHYCIWLYMSCVLKSCYVYVYNVRNMRQLYLHKCVKINNIFFSCLYGSVLLFFYWCFFIGKGGGGAVSIGNWNDPV